MAFVNTVGLWSAGLPELYLRPPTSQGISARPTDTRLAVFLATALIRLGLRLLEADEFTIPPYLADLDGRPVRFWFGDQEPPFEQLARSLGPDVDTVMRVECTLWPAPFFGDG